MSKLKLAGLALGAVAGACLVSHRAKQRNEGSSERSSASGSSSGSSASSRANESGKSGSTGNRDSRSDNAASPSRQPETRLDAGGQTA
jgi:hypothetical protein